MQKAGLWGIFLLAAAFPAAAQVTIEVTQDQDQFLSGEDVIAAVRIANHSGQTLTLGNDPDWLTFSIESRQADVVPKTGDVPVLGEFVLDSSKVATKRVNLAPYFSIGGPGRYTIVATLRINNWNREIHSAPKKFDIIEGAKLWEQEIGVPRREGDTNTSPEVRKYILQQANYLKTRLQLYLRLTDSTGARVFRVVPIGPMVSFGQPESQVDKFSNLHILYQDNAHSFNYTVFNPNGQVVVRDIYDYTGSRPRLQPGQDGRIIVKGGVLRAPPTDAPEPAAPVPIETPPKPSAPSSKGKPGK